MPAIWREIARRKGWLKPDGTPNANRGREWLGEQALTPHHAGGNTIELVPSKLNDLAHIGGAADLRNK
jgi:hypothetical protein